MKALCLQGEICVLFLVLACTRMIQRVFDSWLDPRFREDECVREEALSARWKSVPGLVAAQ